ncbi:MAG: hypothetical protein CVU49_00115 [Candidatus Cloacimonetes bacterium HGW-Cloacimonetes-2]|jgi:GTPase SAR1 family protein|nr:MAG: hypothetical protein CVV34_05400 [Methanomicrobiales archaeon HGW-Methanomicrobiales-5]PKN75811.1 MAG: hypothetical protein CVU49_00115 [Candidatus Cloacimonetes bacterium HGW-Cloacimonetes-2]
MAKMIYFCGADGSGKSTFLREIEHELHLRGYKTQYLWIRSPKILSKPLMLYCHLVGLTKYHVIDGIKFGNHAFEKSPLVRAMFPVLQLIDFKIRWALMISKVRDAEILLLDRFALDTMIDLMVSTKRFDLDNTWVGKSILKMLPQDSLILCFDAMAGNIRKRKPDTMYDTNLELKLKLYRQVCALLGIKAIINDHGFNETRDEVVGRMNVYLEN